MAINPLVSDRQPISGIDPVDNEQQNTAQPAGRQIQPNRVDPQQQMDWNVKQGGEASLDQRIALQADPKTVFATSESAMHNHGDTNREAALGLKHEARVPHDHDSSPTAAPSSTPDTPGFLHNGANGTFVENVANPENARLQDASEGFLQRLADNKVVATKKEDVPFFDATDEFPADLIPLEFFPPEFVPETVESGPPSEWKTADLDPDKQPTSTMVNPFDERKT